MTNSNYFRSIHKTRLSDDIARQIIQAIDEGRFQKDDRLPSIRSLATTFNVSQPIMQEAIRILQYSGYIHAVHGKGVFVEDPYEDIANVPLVEWLKTNISIVRDFYNARLAIEPVCAAEAARNATQDELESLSTQITSMELVFQNSEASLLAGVGPDIDFHTMIATASHNQFLIKMLDSIISPKYDLRKVILRIPNHNKVTHVDHLRIVDAITNHNPDQANKAMIIALSRPLEAIDDYLNSAKGKK